MITAGQVMISVANLMNDPAQTVFSNEVQIPYLNIAIREFKDSLVLANIPITNVRSPVISVPAGVDNIGAGGPALPIGLVEIQQLWQNWAGTSDQFTPIKKYEFLPHTYDGVELNTIPYWAWMGGAIRFHPANTDLDIKIDMISDVLPEVTSEHDALPVPGCQNWLAFTTASLISNFVGANQTRAEALRLEADKDWDKFESINSKGRQQITTRRRPFMASYRQRSVG